MDKRFALLVQWVDAVLTHQQLTSHPIEILEPVSGDASFRRYFRVRFTPPQGDEQTLIAVDAPPEKEDSAPFVKVAQALASHGVNVPQLIDVDLSQGFMLLSDLGNVLFLDYLTPDNVDQLYGEAMASLLTIQQCQFVDDSALPDYDEALLLREMALFTDWFLARHLNMPLTDSQKTIVNNAFKYLCDSVLAQPRVTVHRDYHSRNLMRLDNQPPGIIDFQDAVNGPITYDLVSLLRDCYCAWPKEQVKAWALQFVGQLRKQSDIEVSDQQFLEWFDLMGAQRHLKAIGIFARLWYRDGKAVYLDDMPLTLNYLVQETAADPQLQAFHQLLVGDILPLFEQRYPDKATKLQVRYS